MTEQAAESTCLLCIQAYSLIAKLGNPIKNDHLMLLANLTLRPVGYLMIFKYIKHSSRACLRKWFPACTNGHPFTVYSNLNPSIANITRSPFYLIFVVFISSGIPVWTHWNWFIQCTPMGTSDINGLSTEHSSHIIIFWLLLFICFYSQRSGRFRKILLIVPFPSFQ